MERDVDKRLAELLSKGIPVYSISRLDTINNCLYEAYRTYVLKDKGDNNIYAIMGGKIHDVLQGITENKNTEADLLPAMKSELEDMEIMNLDFPKGRDGGESIRKRWIADMTHFCNTYKAPTGQLKAEEFILYKSPNGNYLQGYIDLQRIRKDSSIDIYDYKTSSLYKGETLKEHARQLIVYALGKRQEGCVVRSASWIFLKYVEVRYIGKKTSRSKKLTEISKVIERCNIGRELEDSVASKLEASGIVDFDQQIILDEFKRTNSFECIPEEIRNQYKVLPYVLSVDLTDENIEETEHYIDSTIDKWEALSGIELDYPSRNFTKVSKAGKESPDIFYCTNLCGHFKKCPHIKEYMDIMEAEKNSEERGLFD